MRFPTTMAGIMLSASCLLSTASAELDYLAAIYGDGVHTFYNGNIFEAEELFNQAISQGYKDPRCYYYRALLHMRMCRQYEAEQDIQMGARYELEGRGTYDVGQALYRIQGNERIQFERLRRDAKLDLVSSRALSTETLEQPYVAPPTTVDPGLPPMAPNLTDPFADDTEEPEVPVEDELPMDAEVDDDNMFDDPAADGGEPFDDAGTGELDDAGGFDDMDATDDAADEDPFGSDDEDPFGDSEDIFDGF